MRFGSLEANPDGDGSLLRYLATLALVPGRRVQRAPVALLDVENPKAEGHGISVPPGREQPMNMWIPCIRGSD